MSGGAIDIAVVCEAAADFRTAGGIVDRVLTEKAPSGQEGHTDALRRWVVWSGNEFLQWRHVRRLCAEHGVRKHGHFGGEPGAPDAHAARRAVLLVRKLHGDAAAILLIRDSDGDASRGKGLEQARDESKTKDRIVVGLCHPKRECWVLAGYAPQSKHESKTLASLIREIGFSPCIEATRLNDRGDNEKRSAKRVLRKLTGGDPERERLCWADADLDTLARNGAASGLSAFMDEVRQRLCPLRSRG